MAFAKVRDKTRLFAWINRLSIFPVMLIKEKPLKHWLDHFYGYGSWDAKIWFIGHEEGGGDLPEEVAEKLTYFSDTHATAKLATLCDIRELYRQVAFRIDGPRAEKFTNLYDHRFGKKATLHSGWKNLIAFAHGYHNKKLPDLLTHQQNTFASPSAHSEALIQLYPLPSSHNHAWYYAWLDQPHFPFLKSRAMYQQQLYPDRIQTILQQIATHKPELVLMYGMEMINVLKNSVQEFIPGAKFTMVKGTKLEIPQHHRTDFNGTTLIITTQVPTLRHNRIETGFDWQLFGKQISDSIF